MTDLRIGDVLVVNTGNNWAEKLICIGEVLRGQAALDSHVAVLHHWTDGVPWALEGRPGGVGWVDARRYIRNARTVTNAEQPKSDRQREQIAALAEAMVGTAYDWQAIAADFFLSMGIREVFAQDWKGTGVPGHVVCSSYATYLYTRAGLRHPNVAERFTFPSDWTEFCLTEAWKK